MAITWTKTFASGDDGSVLTGAQIGQIQADIDTYGMSLADTQTISGTKTFQGGNTHSGNCTFSGDNNHTGTNTFTNDNTFSSTVLFTDKSAITCLSSTAVDMKTAGTTSLYTVPSGKTLVITAVVVRGPTASMAGGTDYDFGTTAAVTSWRQAINLSSMTTATTDFMVIRGVDVTKYTITAATAVFAVKVNTGTTAACTATLDLFGYLY